MADSSKQEVDLRTNEPRDLKLYELEAGPPPLYALGVRITNPGDISGGGSAALPASNVYGEIASLAGAATGTVATVASTVATYRLRGFSVVADGDCRVWVEIASVVVLEGRVSSMQRTLVVQLPNGVDTSTGVAVTLRAENLRGTAIRVAGTLLGEA